MARLRCCKLVLQLVDIVSIFSKNNTKPLLQKAAQWISQYFTSCNEGQQDLKLIDS